ncbi:MAG TPA: acetamidase/formamidase family protein [Gracilimonas sp.]|uniref:acetamidase/formamidase family protein n=1 Tax=Gracilimonas sp. TaxID=1974203 RepID=UPI002D9C5EE2|nr:acetamidase/formamidase family protein [Gracilimonas sp.]
MKQALFLLSALIVLSISGCVQQVEEDEPAEIEYDFEISDTETHARWSSTIEPVLTVPSGSVIKVATQEASANQLDINSTVEDLGTLSFDPIHPLTGPVFVEGAEPGDILKVTLHKVEMGDWGWTAIIPGFGFLADEFEEPYLKTFELGKDRKTAKFSEDIEIPLKPFPGVMGVAPDTDEMLSTIPPRANGGNMDDPNMTEGSVIYFPVFVEGALFSIGDTHAAQGHGEVCGTAIEAPMNIIYEVEVIKDGRAITEPQYETEEYYAVTAFAETIDEAAKKATRFMIDYLEEEKGMSREDAYALCSLAGDLKIAEVVDVPHMLVSMHMPKDIFTDE